MYTFEERNATRRKHSALVLAIGLHIVLGAALYFATTEKRINNPLTSQQQIEKTSPAPQPKAVNIP